jgi:AraC-like DNA-binding protein
MKPDSEPPRLDLVERAHLKEPGDSSSTMYRYAPAPDLAGLVRRFWIPVWSVPPGQEAPQRVLQYPVCLLVVASDYARFYGVVTGLSTTTLTGDGWAVGVMCTPAAGALLAGAPVARYTDRYVDVAEVLGEAADRLVRRVRTAMAGDPHAEVAHRAAMAAFDDALRPFLPVDEEGELVDRLVAFVEEDFAVTRVGQLCDEFGLSERALQRLVHRRLGLTPKWLIQRRRLQEAAERLRTGDAALAETAAVLGYADQAHFVRDFSRVTAMTPGRFAARHRAAPGVSSRGGAGSASGMPSGGRR